MSNLLQGFRYAVRMLAKTPGFTVIAIVTLALGIGANTAIFSVVNAALLRPMPVERPHELVSVYTSDFSGPPYGSSSFPDFLEFRDKTQVFSGAVAYTLQPMSLNTGDTSRRVFGEIVTGNYFDLLGVPAAQGRTFLPYEDRTPGTHPVVVLSHALWQRQFGGDAGVVGRAIRLNGTTFTVIGVAPQSFPGMTRGLQTDLWAPVMMINVLTPDHDRIGNRGSRRYSVLGRLKPGVPLETAQAQFTVLASQLYKAYPGNWSDVAKQGRRISVLSESQSRMNPQLRDPVLAFSVLLMAVVQLVLLTACANVANLLLARAAARRREIAIRLSLGASRGRLLQQLLTESVLLAMAGGAAAVLMTLWATDLLSSLPFPAEADIPLSLDFTPDIRVFAFSFGVSLLTGLLFGLVPAWQATRPDVISALKEEGFGHSGGKNRLRGALVVAQVALSVVLLVGSGLFIRSLQNASSIDPGFDLREGVLLSMDLGLQGYSDERGVAFYDQLLEKARALPGVEAAALSRYMPLGLNNGRRGTTIEGYTRRPGEDLEFHFSVIGPGYFRCLGIPVLRGREFTAQDRTGAPRVAIVNEAFARRFWPDRDPLGKRLSIEGPEGNFMEIVGVVKDGKYTTLGEDPLPWFATPIGQTYVSDMVLVLRTGAGGSGSIKPVVDGATTAIQSLDKALPVTISTVEQHMDSALLLPRVGAALLGGFGGLGLLLAAVGLAGMMAYVVTQRTHEIGVRMALGARSVDVLGLLLRQGLQLTAVGGAIGLAVALGATQMLRGLLYDVSPADPVTFVGVALVLAGVALTASYIPARRATRVDPLVALRHE